MPKVNGLTPKQARFVEEYLIDLNATQAAIRAGYSARSENRAAEIGYQLLQKTPVREAVEALRAAKAEELDLTHERVLRGLLAEAERMGEGTSHAARVSAWSQLGKWRELGMWKDVTEHHVSPLATLYDHMMQEAGPKPNGHDTTKAD